jgi:rRNA maturation RNase YbeY
MDCRINFFTENLTNTIPRKRILRVWIRKIIEAEHHTPGVINIILCDDTFLLKLNKRFLKKHTLTDIITFPTNESPEMISGDLYISRVRVKENAYKYNSTIFNELSRVIIHGILHLLGYTDGNEKEKGLMRRKEEECLYTLNVLQS